MFTKSTRAVAIAALTATTLISVAPSFAQSNRELDERMRRLERAVQSMAQEPAPGMAGPGSGMGSENDLVNRILRIEQLVEQLTGQIEETRFRTQQSANKLDQLANDLSLRVAMLEQGGAIPPGATPAPGAAVPPGAGAALGAPGAAMGAAQTTMAAAPAPRVPPPGSRTFGEEGPLSRPLTPQPTQRAPQVQPQPSAMNNMAAVEDPALSQPTSPGGFGALRTDAQGRPLAADPALANAPPPVVPSGPPPVAPAPQRAPNPAAVASTGLGVQSATPIDVSLPEGTPKQQYDYAFEFLKKQDYGRAEVAFREFMKRYPSDALAGNAQYWLGETHYVRGDYQKSVIEFMSGYQKYPKSNKGPDNLLKLGMSLSHLNQNKEACTALSRLSKEYPDAGEQIKRSVTQERQKLKCA